MTLCLVVRQGGQTIDARLFNSPLRKSKRALQVTTTPEFPFAVETSADGKYLHIIPRGFLAPGTRYGPTVKGNFYTGGLNIGNLTLGGLKTGRFETSLTYTAAATQAEKVPLSIKDERVTALEWTRLAVPILLPSLNQIGQRSIII